MLSSLYIKNYRNLKELRINSLGRVNLITGKNNTGKSTILEAIAIYATKGDLIQLYQLMGERGENFRQIDTNKNATEINMRAFSSLFTNRDGFENGNSIYIGNDEKSSSDKSVSIRFVRYFEEIQTDKNGGILKRNIIAQGNETEKDLANYQVGIEIKVGSESYILSLDKERPYRFSYRVFGADTNIQFIRTRNIDKGINGLLWDSITLTEREKYVIEALKIIEINTNGIAFIEENPGERTAKIKLSNSPNILPLLSMGDGINRILTIILALVNSDNGFLLIDEFENGLHYTVQEKLWEIIFNLSQKLNVQVFVTTHSEDSISSFEKTLNSQEKVNGNLIRLDNIDGNIKQVEFDKKELKIATDNDIEIR